MNREKFNEVFKSISDFFGLLSNPDRIKILGLITKQELDVLAIQEKLKISQSRVSQHLKLLKLNGLVRERREGKHVYYQVKDKNVTKVVESAIQYHMVSVTDPETIALFNELFNMWHL